MIDLTGQRFGRLVVLGEGPRRGSKGQRRFWLCQCDCGTQKEIWGYDLTRPAGSPTRSCGCLANELTSKRSRTHGYDRSNPVYRAWCSMRRRCRNPKTFYFCQYGGRGIRVCERWEKFENFLADMGERPSPAHSLDRIDNDGHYEPGNCRWATWIEQANNRCTNRWIEYQGRWMTLSDWGREVGIRGALLSTRLERGWTEEMLLEIPPWRPPTYSHAGKSHTLAEWAEITGIPKPTIGVRLQKGWSLEKALTTPVRPIKRRETFRPTYTVNGKTHTVKQWSALLGVKVSTLNARLQNGWSVERTFTAPTEQVRNNPRTFRVTYQGRTRAACDWEDDLGLPREIIRQRLRMGWSVERALTTPPRKR